MSNESIVGKVGKFNICFRDVNLSSHAGMAVLQGFIEQLGVAEVLDTELKVKRRERGYAESESVLGLAHNLILGGECLSDLNVVRGDPGTQQLLGAERFIAPTTASEFLQEVDIGDIRYVPREQTLARARASQSNRRLLRWIWTRYLRASVETQTRVAKATMVKSAIIRSLPLEEEENWSSAICGAAVLARLPTPCGF